MRIPAYEYIGLDKIEAVEIIKFQNAYWILNKKKSSQSVKTSDSLFKEYKTGVKTMQVYKHQIYLHST